MRGLFFLFFLLATPVWAAGGVNLDTSTQVTFTDCSSSGSTAQTLAAGDYLMTVHDEAVWLCLADSNSTCSSGGVKFAAGYGMKITIGAGGKSASCRSSGSTGDIQFTKAG